MCERLPLPCLPSPTATSVRHISCYLFHFNPDLAAASPSVDLESSDGLLFISRPVAEF
jgi:hypothetical protein